MKNCIQFLRRMDGRCRVGGQAALALAMLSAPIEAGEGADVLFVLLDDLRWDAMSFLDHPYVETPNIDRLREQGAWMSNAFVSTSICCPSRATFMTGTFASTHGVIDNETSEYDPEITPPLTRYLQEAGYRTAMIGKWHMGDTAAPRPYFDHWISFKKQGKYNDPELNINGVTVSRKGYTTDILSEEAIKFIEAQPKDQPYFCMLSHKAVHEPFLPAARHKDAFGADTVDIEPRSWSEDFVGKPEWQRRQRTRDVRWEWRTRDLEGEVLPEAIEEEAWPDGQKKYIEQFRCLAAVDEGLGKVMRALERRGTLENTLIVFTSDNGYFHGEHRRWDKRLAYEESLRIPMVIAHPGKIEAGATVAQLVSNVDFAPTILDYLGLSVPEGMQGKSMVAALRGSDQPLRDSIFYEYWVDLVHSIPAMTAVRTDRYKLIQYPEIDDIDELYDLQVDPHEMNNLAVNPEHAKLYGDMRKLMQERIEQVGWRPDVFPKNLQRVRGPEGLLLDLGVVDGQPVDRLGCALVDHSVESKGASLLFDGKESRIEIPYAEDRDPSTWPYLITIDVKPESDGVIATQSGELYGFKIFVQDGRPGASVLCETWVAVRTTIDAPKIAFGSWVRLELEIDYNRVEFRVDGEVVDSRPLPQPFKVRTESPLVLGAPGEYPVSGDSPDFPFKGKMRLAAISRNFLNE
ncbi:MAG: sulfatase-like hydrolase/transferase [Verrucomicrobiota bacterium]